MSNIERGFLGMCVVLLILLIAGCGTIKEISKNLKGKTINRGGSGGKLELQTSISDDGMTPQADFKIIDDSYQSAPTLKGQGTLVVDITYSMWTGNISTMRILQTQPLGVKDIKNMSDIIKAVKSYESMLNKANKEQPDKRARDSPSQPEKEK